MRLNELEEYIKRVSSLHNVEYTYNVLNTNTILYTMQMINWNTGKTLEVNVTVTVVIPTYVTLANLAKYKRHIDITNVAGVLAMEGSILTSVSLEELKNRQIFQKRIEGLLHESTKESIL